MDVWWMCDGCGMDVGWMLGGFGMNVMGLGIWDGCGCWDGCGNMVWMWDGMALMQILETKPGRPASIYCLFRSASSTDWHTSTIDEACSGLWGLTIKANLNVLKHTNRLLQTKLSSCLYHTTYWWLSTSYGKILPSNIFLSK